MSLLIESICCVDGAIKNVHYHNMRMNKSRLDLFGCKDAINILDYITIHEPVNKGIWKIRIHYDEAITSIEYELYKKKSIQSLKVVYDDTIDYSFKYADRSHIAKLFEERNKADDILIIKNGFVTDSSSANVVFYDGYKLLTPTTPLLPGTKRAKLIDEGKIIEKIIKVKDISSFSHVNLINAFLDIGDIVIPVTSIIL